MLGDFALREKLLVCVLHWWWTWLNLGWIKVLLRLVWDRLCAFIRASMVIARLMIFWAYRDFCRRHLTLNSLIASFSPIFLCGKSIGQCRTFLFLLFLNDKFTIFFFTIINVCLGLPFRQYLGVLLSPAYSPLSSFMADTLIEKILWRFFLNDLVKILIRILLELISVKLQRKRSIVY